MTDERVNMRAGVAVERVFQPARAWLLIGFGGSNGTTKTGRLENLPHGARQAFNSWTVCRAPLGDDTPYPAHTWRSGRAAAMAAERVRAGRGGNEFVRINAKVWPSTVDFRRFCVGGHGVR